MFLLSCADSIDPHTRLIFVPRVRVNRIMHRPKHMNSFLSHDRSPDIFDGFCTFRANVIKYVLSLQPYDFSFFLFHIVFSLCVCLCFYLSIVLNYVTSPVSGACVVFTDGSSSLGKHGVFLTGFYCRAWQARNRRRARTKQYGR